MKMSTSAVLHLDVARSHSSGKQIYQQGGGEKRTQKLVRCGECYISVVGRVHEMDGNGIRRRSRRSTTKEALAVYLFSEWLWTLQPSRRRRKTSSYMRAQQSSLSLSLSLSLYANRVQQSTVQQNHCELTSGIRNSSHLTENPGCCCHHRCRHVRNTPRT